MKKLLKILTPMAAILAAALFFAGCKQFLDDPEEFLSYWAAEVVSGDYNIDKPTQTNTDGVQCIPSTGDVRLTVKLNNPKNFTLVMPTSPANAGKVINFPGLSPQPVYGTDYTLQQAGSTLNLVYKSAFLKEHEWNTGNIGPEITLIADDGREFSKPFTAHVEVNTPPKLSFTGSIGKTAAPDAAGKHYYVIILKAEDMSETAGIGSSTGKLHKDIQTLAVEGGASANISFTTGYTAFTVNTSTPITSRRLLAATEVTDIVPADLNGQPVPSWAPSHNADPWVLRYRTDTEVKGAQALYKFRLYDEKGLSSEEVSASTVKIKAEDVRLFDGANSIPAAASVPPPASPPPPSMHTINAESSAANVTVKAKTATVGAIITGRVERYNSSTWEQVGALINSGSQNEYDIDLPAPGLDQEAVYKITLTAGGIGFSPGNEKVFYVKVTQSTTITIDAAVSSTWNGKHTAWDALKHEVENLSGAATIKISGEINAPSGPNEHINVKRAVTIEGSNKNNDKLNGKDRTYVFHVWYNGDLKLKKLTLQNGNSLTISGVVGGGAIYCADGKLTADDVIIKNCKAKKGGGIYLNGSSGMTLTNCQIINNNVTNGNGGGITFGTGGSYDASEYTITGGKISGNTVTMTSGVLTYSGAGLAITNVNIKLTLNGCEISSNTIAGAISKEPRGAGMWLGNKANCTIKGSAQIKDNKLHETGSPNSFIGTGGGIQFDGGTLTLESGTIISGNCAKDGGGVHVGLEGTFIMKDGTTISGNQAAAGGGVYIRASQASARVGTFKMEGSATVTPSIGGDADVPGKNDVYLHNDSNYVASIIVTDELTAAPAAARLTMMDRGSTPGVDSGYYPGRVGVKGSSIDTEGGYKLKPTDAAKFQVTPGGRPPQNWKVVHDGNTSGALRLDP